MARAPKPKNKPRPKNSLHESVAEDTTHLATGLVQEQQHTSGGDVDRGLQELQNCAEALIAALAEARCKGPGSERRREAQKVARKYIQIKALKVQASSGQNLEPLQVAKLRSEISVLKALAQFWQSQVHLEVEDGTDADVQIGEADTAGTSLSEDAKQSPQSGASAPQDLDAIVASSLALHQKSTRSPCAKSTDEPIDSLPQLCATRERETGVQVLPWQVAQRRAKMVAKFGKVTNELPTSTSAELSTNTAAELSTNTAAAKVQQGGSIRRRWQKRCPSDGIEPGVEELMLDLGEAAAAAPTCLAKPVQQAVPTCIAKPAQHAERPIAKKETMPVASRSPKPRSHAEETMPVAPRSPKPMDTAHLAHDWRLCIVGDSGLQLNKKKGTSGFEEDLKCILGPNLEVVRRPGEGAEAITAYLRRQHGVAHIVVAVWFLNEFFHYSGKLIKSYPEHVNVLAKELASTLLKFPYHAAVIGGSAALWKCSGEFDIWANRIRDIVSEQGVFVVDGVDGYSTLELTKDCWHARSTFENKQRMAAYFASVVRTIVPNTVA